MLGGFFSKITRDVMMFAIGASGFYHELILQEVERPTFIAAACALMGLPFVLRGDEARREKKEKE